MKTAILIPTCDAYVDVAKITIKAINLFWKDHPQIRIYGTSLFSGNELVMTQSDPGDWIGLANEAVEVLITEKYTHVYLILDDHLPFYECNDEYLNRLLPDNFIKLNAVYAGLNGWDQYAEKSGEYLGSENLEWMRNSGEFKWKFSLHPAFWDLNALKEILQSLMKIHPRPKSAREFESNTGNPAVNLPDRIRKYSFRIKGDGYAAGNLWFHKKATRFMARQYLNAVRLASKLAGGKRILQRVDDVSKIWTNYYNGPYPHYWSGLMHHGSLFADAVEFIKRTGNNSVQKLIDDNLKNKTGI